MAGAIGFGDNKKVQDEKTKLKETRKSLEKIFPPEFLNRIDEITLFTALNHEENLKIMDIMLRDVQDRLKKLQYQMTLTKRAKEFLVDQGTNEKYGARPLKRAIQRFVENPLAEMILNSEIKSGDTVKVGFDKKKDGLKFTVSTKEPKGEALQEEK